MDLTRANRRLHAISNPILYETDLRDTGGVISMCFGLASERINIVKLCLSAGCKPDLRIETCHDLNRIFLNNNKKDDALNFSMWFSKHLQIARNGCEPFERGGYRGGHYSDSDRDGNKPFQSVKSFFWTPLHFAAIRNDVELLALLLDHGASPNAGGRGVCPCYWQRLRRTVDRCEPPQSEFTAHMLERRLVTRWSPLHVAVCHGNLDCVEYLVSRFGLPHST